MKMFLEILLIALVVLILLYLSFNYAQVLLAPSPSQNLLESVCFGQNCFTVQIAKTEARRNRGLMFKESLDPDEGMLFIFDQEAIHSFWMKNTLIPLDIIWLDGNARVVFIVKNVQPCPPAQAGKSLICPSVVPPVNAKYVLELNSGICDKINLTTGAQLKIPASGDFYTDAN